MKSYSKAEENVLQTEAWKSPETYLRSFKSVCLPRYPPNTKHDFPQDIMIEITNIEKNLRKNEHFNVKVSLVPITYKEKQ